MYLYEKDDKFIKVYSFVPDREELIKIKKKYLEDIKSVIVHINNESTLESLYNNFDIGFSNLDRKEIDGRITYIEEVKNEQSIEDYIDGKYDFNGPKCIFGDYRPPCKSIYSGDLNNEDCALLFTGAHPHNKEWLTEDGILLTGYLANFQLLLSNDINNILYPNDYKYLDDETIDFFKIFSCIKERIIKMDDLKFMKENGFIQVNNSLQETFEKSEVILNSYNKVKKITKQI